MGGEAGEKMQFGGGVPGREKAPGAAEVADGDIQGGVSVGACRWRQAVVTSGSSHGITVGGYPSEYSRRKVLDACAQVGGHNLRTSTAGGQMYRDPRGCCNNCTQTDSPLTVWVSIHVRGVVLPEPAGTDQRARPWRLVL